MESEGLNFQVMSTVNYNFSWPSGPSNVVVTGEFDAWKGGSSLKKSSTSGEFEVTLPIKIPAEKDKIFFKFIVDGQWITSGFYKIGTDAAGIENNYISRQDLYRLLEEQTGKSGKHKSGVAAHEQGGTAEAAVVRSSKNLDVKSAASQGASPDSHSGQRNHGHDEPTGTARTPTKTKEFHRDASSGAANASSAASAEFPARSAGVDPLAASAAASALKRVKIKRRVKRNKKTGEKIVVSEERIPLNEGDDTVVSGTTFEEEVSSPAGRTPTNGSAQGTPHLANVAAGAVSGTNTPTPTPTRQEQKYPQPGVSLGSGTSPSSSPSIRKTRPLSTTGSTKERLTSTVGRPTSQSRSRSNTPVGSSGSATASAGATAATAAAARKDHSASAVMNDSTAGSAHKTVSRSGSTRKTSNELDTAEARNSSGAIGPLGTRLPEDNKGETVHILPVDTSNGGNSAFKSVAGEPGPFVPTNQEQLKAFSEVNDNVDPQAFNEKLNKQFKAEHNTERESSKKSGEKIGEGDAGEKLENHDNLQKSGKQALQGEVKKNHSADLGVNSSSNGKDDNSGVVSSVDTDTGANNNGTENAVSDLSKGDTLKELGEDASQGKVSKDDALKKLDQDSTLKGVHEGTAAGVPGSDTLSKKKLKNKMKKKNQKKNRQNKKKESSGEESREKSATPDTNISSEVPSGEEKGTKGADETGATLGSTSAIHSKEGTPANQDNTTAGVAHSSSATGTPSVMDTAAVPATNANEEKLEISKAGEKARLEKESGPLGEDVTSATGAPANIPKQSDSPAGREVQESKPRKEQEAIPTLDPRAKTEPVSSQQHFESDQRNEASFNSSKQRASETTTQQAPKTITDDTGVPSDAVPSKESAKKANKAAPVPAKSEETYNAAQTDTKRHSVVDSRVKSGKSPQSKSPRPKSTSDTIKKESKKSTTGSVPGSSGSPEKAADAAKGAINNQDKKETTSNALKEGKSEIDHSKDKTVKNAAAGLTKTGKSGVEQDKSRDEVFKEVSKQGKAEVESPRGKSAKNIVTDAAKTDKKEADTSKGKDTKGVTSEAATTEKSGADATANARQKAPAQSSLANASNRTEKKKKTGLWSKIKKIFH